MESDTVMGSTGFQAIACFLFFLEIYHFIGHCCVFFRIRLLPTKDLIKVKYYFLIDAMTVFATNILYTGQLRWLAVLQNIQHLFFYFTWNKHPYTKRVIAWSSLDWQFGTQSIKTWDIALGTFFDIFVHAVNMYILSQFLSGTEIIVAIVLVLVASSMVLFNKRLAWATPGSTPTWVSKRVRPVSEYLGTSN